MVLCVLSSMTYTLASVAYLQRYLRGDTLCEHLQNDRSVRDMLGQRGIQPEDLPPAEDIKKLEWRVKS